MDENLKHHFTISSSPTEDFLQFTTKFREESDYKKALWQRKIGDELEINGPFGNFVLDEKDTTPRLFIAGGIGITPFRSMIKYVSDKQLTLPIKLLYSVKSKAEAAFAAELSDLRIVETEKEGRLDKEKIEKYCLDWKERSWWVCGPPAMVEATTSFAPTGKVTSEEFIGY
ncbi:MAG: putative oxidoreductase FAD/NAD(P)-binding component [Microgenomates group bacterium GW2011_GWC1_46_20]|nr:MAG: putative oxidoreductase FAD/NAD(P)-binding component [Microgenomates group bacterium GW2011_GWC1_46_20]